MLASKIKNLPKLPAEWRPKVLVTHCEIPQAGLDILRQKCEVILTTGLPQPTREEVLRLSKGVDGILWANHEKLNAEALDVAGPQLKAISTMSAGIDYVDVKEVKKRNIPLGYTPTVLNDSVADIAVALAVAAGRRFHEGQLKIAASEWERRPQWMLGRDIRGSTVGIVGLGGIGQTIIERFRGFNVGEFLYTGHKPKPEAVNLNASFVSFDDLLRRSDYVILSCPLNPETKHLINKDALAKMKPTSVLINVARGEIVDQEALLDALQRKQIFAAGLDVTTPEPLPADHPLLTLPNCFIIPHLGSATVQTRSDMATVAALNVLQGLAGEPMFSPVP
ncbi:glyoxylate reductase/hydroxypyruvate reductase-like [Lutzomyia longipalpis]|nr:glyoxylate reductase/hydroxypyruvate reductase-like [Lutzomyia longipalpis]XP_055683027.1 glyoxylate reductase/hydroxypyruvate reductase-like [Lutzomyia longipalpis]XP_055683028.1 glyoxylate reductase/hydroxypyruvate reductase-like [Lutzomyia longipalpis]